MALLCLGYDPTITNSVWLVKVAIRSRRQSIWVTYTSRRYTAFYTGFRCMLQLYIDLASSRLACRDIQPIQLYSYTAIHAIQHTALYSVPQETARSPLAFSPHLRVSTPRRRRGMPASCCSVSFSHYFTLSARPAQHPTFCCLCCLCN